MDFSRRLNHQCLPFFIMLKVSKSRLSDRKWEIKAECPVHMSRDCAETCKRFISCICMLLLYSFIFFHRVSFSALFFFSFHIFRLLLLQTEKNSLSTFWKRKEPLYSIMFLCIVFWKKKIKYTCVWIHATKNPTTPFMLLSHPLHEAFFFWVSYFSTNYSTHFSTAHDFRDIIWSVHSFFVHFAYLSNIWGDEKCCCCLHDVHT